MSADNSPKPVCSVCIANYNGMGYIKACIDSVRNQDIDFPVEIIVHDDASTDDSVKFIRENYPDVILIPSAENVGFCISNNRMAERASGEYLLLLNNDAQLFPNALKELFSEAQKEPAILGPSQYNAATRERIDTGNFFDFFLNTVPNQNPEHREVGMVSGACLWIPKQLWNELGGFPEWFHTLSEDIHICCLARLKGYSVKALGDTGFYHRVGASLGGGKIIKERLVTSMKRRALSERNRSFAMTVCYPFPIFQMIFPFHVMLLLLEGLILSLMKKDADVFFRIYLAAVRSLWTNRKILALTRKSVQSGKNISCQKFFSVFEYIPYKIKMLAKYGMPQIR